MPVSSLSTLLTTSIYILSSASFLAFTYDPLLATMQAAQVRVALSTLEGIQEQLNSLEPGMTAELIYHTAFQSPLIISFNNKSVIATIHDAILVKQVKYTLPNFVLYPEESYIISLKGEQVSIEKSRFD